MSFITKKLEEFINKFGLNGLHAKPVEYMDYEDVTDKVEAFLSTALNEMIKEVEKGFPEEKPMSVFSFVLKGEELERYMRYKGFNECRGAIKQSLSSLREGNK